MKGNNGQVKRRRRKNRKKSTKDLFIKTLLISLSVFSIIIFGSWTAIRSLAKPPEIPKETQANNPNLDEVAFLPPHGDAEDMLIGDGLTAPEGFTASDRKELFYTFLIVGMDEGINTDTIMVASYDAEKKEANIIGIPRDSLINVKRKVKKINTAYAAGTLHGGGKDGGIDQLKREVKTIVGFVPDFYVCIDLNAFVKIVDAVGGITIDVPMNMVYDDPTQNLHINIKKGEQSLGGKEALKFARYRKGNYGKGVITDYQRIQNQHAVIKAVLSKLIRPENILKISEFIEIFNENVSTDIKAENMLWFAEQLNNIREADALSTHTMPTTGTSGLPMYYEYLDEDAIIELVNQTINPYKKDIEAKDLDIITGVN